MRNGLEALTLKLNCESYAEYPLTTLGYTNLCTVYCTSSCSDLLLALSEGQVNFKPHRRSWKALDPDMSWQ
jgi:hypothetical protein